MPVFRHSEGMAVTIECGGGIMSMAGGVTESERLLSQFCQNSFLKLWTYPNPYKDDGKEMCDSIAVFGVHVFIFFDRHNVLPHTTDKDPLILWERWKSKVIDKQIVTAHGVERYIKSGKPIFFDGKRTRIFPLNIDLEKAIFHKIIVAHGARDACINASSENIYGSLGITYTDITEKAPAGSAQPFSLVLDKKRPVNILDSHNLEIILGELDTVTDFANYLDEKAAAISKLKVLSYCGEEDLLAHYYRNLDENRQRHFIGSDDPDVNGVMISEGEWKGYIESDTYAATKAANVVSYMWDELIQRTCQYFIDEKLMGNADLLRGPSAIYEMVQEPRFMRRCLAQRLLEAIETFPAMEGGARKVTMMSSITKTTAYLFLQIKVPDSFINSPDVREKRQAILEIACGAAKNKFPGFTKIVGIGVEPPKYSRTVAEDFILMPCEVWTEEMQAHYQRLNKLWNFFETPSLTQRKLVASEFLQSQGKKNTAQGRNDRCSCGSGIKFKKCCGR
ncbi:YecA family protein [Pseudomonas sp. W5-01]|uniref:YecA family protein n=1 Tax=Pseudomonas sp. W5-01 TaxID=3097454 RepID=UPI00397D4244